MNPSHPQDLELAELRAEVRALEQTCEERRRVGQELLHTEQRLRAILDATQNGVAISENGVVVEANDRLAELVGYTRDELIGMSPRDLNPPAEAERALQRMRDRYEKPYEAVFIRKDGSLFDGEVFGKAILYQGRPARITLVRDITERKRAEEALRASVVQSEVLKAQEALFSALSTPLLPISEEVLVLPLIGTLTAERAAQVLKTLVEGVAARRAHVAILDITGVPDVDAHVADTLIHAARAVHLLGARVILTGIRPEVARRLVHLGIDLTGIMTYGTLQRGIAHALARRETSTRASP